MPAEDPRDGIFRKMLVLSGIVHFAALIASAVWMGLLSPRLRPIPDTFVNLVGGAEFERLAGRAARAPEARREEPPPEPRRGKEPRAEPEKKRAREAPARGKVEQKPRAPAPPASREAMAPPDASALNERIRKLREARVGSERIRALAREAGREKEYRSAVGNVRERAAHKIDLTRLRPASREGPQAAQAGLAGGSQGSARVTPDQMRYFRELDDKVRENWTVSSLAGKDSSRLMVQLRITIERDGRVSDVRMEKSSGNGYFDDSVLRAIRKASPLPVPPETLRGGGNQYEVGFRFFGEGG